MGEDLEMLQMLRWAAEAANDLKERTACEESLVDFVERSWPIIDPGEPLVRGWAMDAICDHVQAVGTGHIKRLLITVPPGFSKSTITNVCFPAWMWTNRPEHRFISASYSDGTTKRDNERCRRIITSEWYQNHWGEKVQLSQPNQASYYGNTRTGWRLATSVGGQLIGWRANVIILDDPNNPKGEESAVRASTNVWFREVVPTRLNNMQRDAIILIQQRLHLEDCAGTALGSNVEWVHLNVPMEYEPRRYVNGYRLDSDAIETFLDEDVDLECKEIFWYDPREDDGDLAWPERFGRQVVDDLKDILGPTMVAAQLQQHPIPRGGSIIKQDWWQTPDVNERGPYSYIVASVDTAYTEDKHNDPSAMTVWGLKFDEYGNPQIHLLEAWQDWLVLNDLVERIIDQCQKDDRIVPGPRFPVDMVLIESKANGMPVAQEIERLLAQRCTFGVELCDPRAYGGDKVQRLEACVPTFARKTVYAPQKDWADKVIQQCASVPYTTDDHLADTVAMAIRWFREHGYAPTREEAAEKYIGERMFRSRSERNDIAKNYFS